MDLEEEPLTHKVIKNSFWNMLTLSIGKFGGLIFSILVARLLLPDKFGIYSLSIAIVLLITTLTNLGTNQTLSRYLSDSLGRNQKKKAASYRHYLSKIKVLFAFFSMIFLFIIAYPLSNYIFNKPALFVPLLLSSLYIVTLSFHNFYETFFFVIGNLKHLAIKEVILQGFKILLIFFAFYFIAPRVSLAIFVLILSSIIGIIFLYFSLKKKVDYLFKKTKEEIDKKRVKKFLKNTIFSSVSSTLFGYVDLIILGIFVTSSYIGYYTAAGLIVGGFFGILIFSNLFLPIFTKMKHENLSGAFNKIFRHLCIITIPFVFVILTLGKYFLRAIYGYEYLPAALPMFFLAFLIFEIPITENLKALLFAREKPKIVAKIISISLILNILLDIIIISFFLNISMAWAIAGAAIATIMSRFFLLFSLSIGVKKELGVSYNWTSIIKPILASLVFFAVISFINYQIGDMTLLLGLLELILALTLYLGIMFLTKGINKQDVQVFKEIISNKFKRVRNHNKD